MPKSETSLANSVCGAICESAARARGERARRWTVRNLNCGPHGSACTALHVRVPVRPMDHAPCQPWYGKFRAVNLGTATRCRMYLQSQLKTKFSRVVHSLHTAVIGMP
eukprot:SAG31_NODE_1104_length_9889_cov_4.328396_5_plen_108_part_00